MRKYNIIEGTTGFIVDCAEVNAETRKLLEECGFICKPTEGGE